MYLFFIFVPLLEVGSTLSLLKETQASLTLLVDLLKRLSDEEGERGQVLGSITSLCCKDVTFFHYEATRPSLTGITVSVTKGQTLAVIGPSGAGKTTLLRILTGLYRPYSGQLSYNELEIDQICLQTLREQIGIVTQDSQLFYGSIRQNLLFACPNASEEQCLCAIRGAAAEKLLVQGLDTVLGEGGLKLSGGERQRICIARALLRRPKLLILDEATSALDFQTEAAVIKNIGLLGKREEMITVVVSHRASAILNADQILVLDSGAIVEQGTPEELVKIRGFYYAIWNSNLAKIDVAK